MKTTGYTSDAHTYGGTTHQISVNCLYLSPIHAHLNTAFFEYMSTAPVYLAVGADHGEALSCKVKADMPVHDDKNEWRKGQSF